MVYRTESLLKNKWTFVYFLAFNFLPNFRLRWEVIHHACKNSVVEKPTFQV
jgi:hypothetical protein